MGSNPGRLPDFLSAEDLSSEDDDQGTRFRKQWACISSLTERPSFRE